MATALQTALAVTFIETGNEPLHPLTFHLHLSLQQLL